MRKTYKKHKGKKYKSHKNSRALHKTIRRNKTRIHKNRTMTGGSLIGQGNFGCAFRPELTAKPGTTHDKNVVSKVVLKNKKPTAYTLANRYFKFLSNRTDLADDDRYKSIFII